MTALSKRTFLLLLSLMTLTICGCGGGGGSAATPLDTSSVQRGSVIQGPVLGATVFADNVAAGSRFVQDAGEISAQSGAGGSFFLPSFPGYDFILVSTGGTDTITGQPALLLLAQAGSANITPLTTLVTLDTTKTVQARLEALNGGRRFDTNVSTDSSPAILLLIKSAETSVQLVSDAVRQAATTAGTTVSQAQINYIQAQTWREIALAFAATSANLATPAGLDAALSTAMSNAITAIRAEPANSNITSFASLSAGIIAHNAVNTSLTALGTLTSLGAPADRTSAEPLGTSTVRAESSLTTSVFAATVSTTLTVLKNLSSVIVIGVTPNPYSPAVIPVVTITNATIIQIITGATGGSGGTGVTF